MFQILAVEVDIGVVIYEVCDSGSGCQSGLKSGDL